MKEIEEIAKAYAESKCSIQEFLQAYDRRDNLKEAFYKEALAVLEWVSKDYCIISKEQICMRHGVANALMKQDPVHREFYRGQSSVLESIFGKELFEEKKFEV